MVRKCRQQGVPSVDLSPSAIVFGGIWWPESCPVWNEWCASAAPTGSAANTLMSLESDCKPDTAKLHYALTLIHTQS